MKWDSRLLVIAVLAVGSACSPSRHSLAAFHLPPDGNIERGKAAFVEFGCNGCHSVSGVDLPRPTAQPPVPVPLGGLVEARLSDAYLVTSIIYPSYDLGPYPKDQITIAGQSRMPAYYADHMTVRELADIVAFLQSRYVIERIPENYR